MKREKLIKELKKYAKGGDLEWCIVPGGLILDALIMILEQGGRDAKTPRRRY